MDKRIEIWNVLHDGEITAVERGAETLTIFVSVPYLRRRIKPLGDSFVIELGGTSLVEFRGFDGTVGPLEAALEDGRPEILSTESGAMPVEVETTLGQLRLDFQSVYFALDTGESIEYEAIARVCEEYWAEFKAKAEQAAAADRPKTGAG